MKRAAWGVWTLAGWLVASAASAQVELTWKLAHNRTVLLEPIRATVAIVNNTGQTLDLTPRGNAHLFFDVEDQPTSPVPASGRPLLAQPVLIPSGETREIDVNLLDAYRIVKGQTYMLRPALEFAGLRFFGERLALEVQPGFELVARAYGVPAAGDARKVSLRLINRDRNDHLFFRIDDASTDYCLGVYDLGRVIRFFAPVLEQDRDGVFHVLHQTAPDRFAHSAFDHAGAPQGTAFYVGTMGGIHLARTATGAVEVQGGTPFVEDAEHPGQLVAPTLPPSHPYATTLGEPPAERRAAEKERNAAEKKKARAAAAEEKSHAGSDAVSW